MPRNDQEGKKGMPDSDREHQYERDVERHGQGQKGKPRPDQSDSTDMPGKHKREQTGDPGREKNPNRK